MPDSLLSHQLFALGSGAGLDIDRGGERAMNDAAPHHGWAVKNHRLQYTSGTTPMIREASRTLPLASSPELMFWWNVSIGIPIYIEVAKALRSAVHLG